MIYSSDVSEIRIVPKHSGADVSISATSYLTYQQCPARADARYKGHYSMPSRASFTGSLAHGIFRRHLESGPIPPETFGDVCRQEIGSSPRLNQTMGELGVRFGDLDGIFREVQELYQRFVRFPQEGFAGAELHIEVVPVDGVKLVGWVDAIYLGSPAGHRLVDWKTGDLGDAPIQMSFYSLLWALDRDELPAEVEAISVKTGERYTSNPRRDDVVETAAKVTAMVDELRGAWSAETDLVRRGGPWCRHCPILDDCPEGMSAVRVLDGVS